MTGDRKSLEGGTRCQHEELGTVWIEGLINDYQTDEIYVVRDADFKLHLVYRYDLTPEVDDDE